MTTIREAVQTLEPGAEIALLTVDGTEIGAGITRWHGHAQEESIWFQGLEYLPWPYEFEGLSQSGQSQPQPQLTVSNYHGVVTALCMSYQDMVGATVILKRTYKQFLDAQNFPGGVNPDANPAEEFQPEIWMIDRKAYEDRDKVQFELASAMDLAGQQLPGRMIVAARCLWLAIGGYRGPYCGYAGGPVAKADDTPTAILAEDKCAGRVVSCKLRFGEDAELPHGGFPAAGMVR